jgi:hypothetical protein
MSNIDGVTNKVNGLDREIPDRAAAIDQDNPDAGVDNDNPTAPPPIWGTQEATAAFKRMVAKYGPKDVLGVIPPNAEVARKGLEKDRGKLPGYYNSNSPEADPYGGTWRGRSEPLYGPEADNTLDRIKKSAQDGAVVGSLTRNIHFFDNDGSDERITRGINAIITQETGAVLARFGANDYRCSFPFTGAGLRKIRLIYWRKGTPQPTRGAPALELLAVGQYTNVYGPHKSGVLYSWQGGDFCDPNITHPKLDIPTTDRVYAKVCEYLDAEGYEWKFTVGKGGARLHASLCVGEGTEEDDEEVVAGGSASAPRGRAEKPKKETRNARRRRGGDRAPSLVDLAGLLEACPNDFEEEDEFFEAMMCIVGASGGDEPFYEQKVLPWALGWPENTPEYVRTKWGYAKRTGACLGWSRLCQITGFIPPDTFADPVPPEYMNAPDPRKVARDAAVARYVYVSALDRVWDEENTSLLTASQFNARNTDLARHGLKGVKSAYSEFMNAAGRRTVDTLTYRPGGERLVIEERDGKEFECANTWRSGPKPIRGVIPSVWIKHGNWLLGTSQFAILCQWLAWMVQNPGVKSGWTPIIVGPQGVGKDALFAPIRHALGNYNVACINFSRLTARFNADWAQKQFVLLNEAKVSDARKAGEVYNEIKTLFSSYPPYRDVEQKNVQTWKAPNIQNGAILTNHYDAIPLEPDDRRMGVFQAEQDKNPGEEHFASYFAWCPRDDAPGDDAAAKRKRAGAEVMGYLLDLDISAFKPETAPETEAKRAMIRAHRPDNAETWLADALDENGLLQGRDVVAFDEIQDLLRKADHHAVSTTMLTRLLMKHGFSKRETAIRTPNGQRKFLWVKGCLLAQLPAAKLAKRWEEQSAKTAELVAEMSNAEGWQ